MLSGVLPNILSLSSKCLSKKFEGIVVAFSVDLHLFVRKENIPQCSGEVLFILLSFHTFIDSVYVYAFLNTVNMSIIYKNRLMIYKEDKTKLKHRSVSKDFIASVIPIKYQNILLTKVFF